MATFHVDYLNGSNTNDGSAANPYATVKYALETNSLTTGDEVKVAGGAETTVDSAATFTTATSLTTSTDLTSSISVGDIVRIDPPNPSQFQGWLVAYVSAINATTITLYEDITLPGTYSTGNWTIKTLSNVVSSTAGTFEEWADATVGAGVDIIFGYNSTFTSVIGRTYFRRSLGAGATSGTLFRVKYNSGSQGTGAAANFVNMGALQWNEVIRGEFGGGVFGDNLLAYQCGNNTFGYFGHIAKKTSNQTDHANLYLVNCGGVVTNGAYAWANLHSYSFYNNWFVFSGNRAPQLSQSLINDITVWNPGQSQHDAQFGATNSLKCYAPNNVVKGHLTFNSIDNNRAGFAKGVVIFGANGGVGSLTATLDGFTILDGGLTTAYWDFFSGASGEPTAGTFDVKLPSGSDLTTMAIKADRNSESYIQPNAVVRDDNYVWKKCSSGYVAVDTTDYSTGDSSKTFYCGNRGAYATDATKIGLFGFTKQAVKPTSYTIRYKVESGASFTGVRLITMLGHSAQYVSNSMTLNATTFTDITVVVPGDQATQNAYDGFKDEAPGITAQAPDDP